MTPVFPCLIRRSQDGWRGELVLRLRNGNSAYVVHLSLEQARMVAVEMRGLASDHCPLHHMTVRMAEALNARVSHVVIQRSGSGDEVAGLLRMVTSSGLHSITVDAAASLALAIHMGLPVFMDGDSSTAEPDWEAHNPQSMAAEERAINPTELPKGELTSIPQAFQEVIDRLKLPEGPDDSESPEGRSEREGDL